MKYVKGDVTTADQMYIIHGCNAQGVMGSGVALAVKQKWPECYLEYVNFIKNHKNQKILGSSVLRITEDGKVIGNLITQEYFGSDGKAYASRLAILDSIIEFILDLEELSSSSFKESQSVNHFEIASPKIGCGLGGLKWEDVSKIYEGIEKNYNVTFIIYEI